MAGCSPQAGERPAGHYAGTGMAMTGAVVGLDVPPEGSTVIPIRSPDVTRGQHRAGLAGPREQAG